MLRSYRLMTMITAILFGAFTFFGLTATPAFAAQDTISHVTMTPPRPMPGYGFGNPGPNNQNPGNPGLNNQGDNNNHCYPSISKDARGSQVQILQTLLRQQGYQGQDRRPLPVRGYFDNDTISAVKAFQQHHGIVADGVVGPATWRALGECNQH